MSAHSTKLAKFLLQRKSKPGGVFTHTSFAPPESYNFEARGKGGYDTHALDSLYTLVCNTVKSGAKLSLTEKPGKFAPLRIDFDLKLPGGKTLDRKYTLARHVVPLIRICQEVIADIVEDDSDPDVYACVVLEKPSPRMDQGFVKDGFHFHFPFFVVNSWVHDRVTSLVETRMLAEGVWNKTPYAEAANKIVDSEIFHKTWLMYGCSKSLGVEPYLATHYYKVDAKPTTIEKMFEKVLTNRNCSATYYLPRLLSIIDHEPTAIKDSVNNLRAASLRKARSQIQNYVANDANKNPDEDIEEVVNKELLTMLAPFRAYDYDEWHRIGRVLYSISQGSERGLEVWDKWSRRDKLKYEPEACAEAWSKMKPNNYTIATLVWLAKQDSPDLYRMKRDEDVANLIDRLLESRIVPLDVAVVFKKLYPDQFVCANTKETGVWFEFKNHRWHVVNGISSIWNTITSDFRLVFQHHKTSLSNRTTEAMERQDKRTEDYLKRCEKNCYDLIADLGHPAFQNQLISQLKHLYHDPKFMDLKDENKLLWVCENGVIDLASMTFRPGRPDDYCTYSCGLNYVEYENDDPDVKTLEQFFSKVFVREEYRNFFLDNVCSIMEGGNPNKNFIIGTGGTNGGKSVTYSLLRTMCGGDSKSSYVHIFPREMFTARANASGSARPDLSAVRGKRLAVVNELTKEETLNIGVLKEVTGNDAFYTRALYKEPDYINPMFKLFMHCNDPPKIPGHDEATWGRAAFLPFESKFVLPHKIHEEPVPETLAAQFKAKKFVADLSLSSKINQLAQAFLWMMFKRYQIYRQTGLVTPECVLAVTSEERNRHDIWQQYKDDRLVLLEREYPVLVAKDIKADTPVIDIKDMHLDFVTWYREAYPSSRDKIDKEALDRELSSKIGRPIRKGQTRIWPWLKFVAEEAPKT